jgi:hypothetical protein
MNPRNLKADQSTRLKTGRSQQKNWRYLAKKNKQKILPYNERHLLKMEGPGISGQVKFHLGHATQIH